MIKMRKNIQRIPESHLDSKQYVGCNSATAILPTDKEINDYKKIRLCNGGSLFYTGCGLGFLISGNVGLALGFGILAAGTAAVTHIYSKENQNENTK